MATKVFIQSAGLTVREEVYRKAVTNFVSTLPLSNKFIKETIWTNHNPGKRCRPQRFYTISLTNCERRSVQEGGNQFCVNSYHCQQGKISVSHCPTCHCKGIRITQERGVGHKGLFTMSRN